MKINQSNKYFIENRKRRVMFLLSIIIIAFVITVVLAFKAKNNNQLKFANITNSAKPLYKGGTNTKVSVFAENIPQITDIEITPDGTTLLAATLTGKIYAFQKINGEWVRQTKEFFNLETFQPGFPPEEAGLTGIILAADFTQSKEVFLNYAYSPIKKQYKNRVTKVILEKKGEQVFGKSPKMIFEANINGAPSHQIQDGVGLMVNNKPHILFGIGEGFESDRSLNITEEAGKLILIQSDGSAPIGERPYDNPKIQAIGLRNPPDIAINPINGLIAVADTGPDHFDRLLYGKLVDLTGNNVKRLNFNWDGKEESLNKYIANPFGRGNLSLYKWNNTETPVALNFLDENRIIVTLFGKTGSKENIPGKKILLGTITGQSIQNDFYTQGRITFKTLVERDKVGEGELAHPIGTAIDPITKDIYFGDLMEGRIYKVTTDFANSASKVETGGGIN